MNINRFILKLALSAGLAYAVGNAMHSQRISYVIYGAVLCMHPIAGDNVGYTLDKLRAAALGATVGMIVNVAFQSNTIAMLAVGPAAMVIGGYCLGLPPRVLNFSSVVCIMAITSTSYSAEPFNYIGLRFWNIFQGGLVGMAVNLLLWPDRDVDKLGPSVTNAIADLRRLFDEIVVNYREGKLAENVDLRRQLITDVQNQLSGIDKLMGNVKNEVSSPFANTASFERWVAVQTRLQALLLLMGDLHLALEGGDGDRLYETLHSELKALVHATEQTFARLSNPGLFQGRKSIANPLANFPILTQALGARIAEIDQSETLQIDPAEMRRFAAFVYGLRAIASDLQALFGECKFSQ
ncbi:MAG: FUSC family protein [Cyanobacteria bacterium P01_H01_bin.15]